MKNHENIQMLNIQMLDALGCTNNADLKKIVNNILLDVVLQKLRHVRYHDL